MTIALTTKQTNRHVKAFVSALILAFLCLYNYQLTFIPFYKIPSLINYKIILNNKFRKEMGCTQSDTVENGGLKTQLSRVKFACDIRKQRASDELNKNQKQLSLQFIKPPHSRSTAVQKVMIQGNSRIFRQSLLYLFLENESKIVLERAGILSNQRDLERVKESINSLLYASTFMKFEQLQKFVFMFRSRFVDYPKPKDSDITNGLLKEAKHNQIGMKTQLQYIFQYSLNHGISMEHINSIGHNYKYGAEQQA